jgi:NAD(P)-dependent dehydrogenase (short-subunit alcohol dehydrogenase family)
VTGRPLAIVTGGAGRLGGGVSRGLVEDGHHVLVLDRVEHEPGDGLEGAVVDLTDEVGVQTAVDDGVARWGAPAVLVTCHGWSPKGPDGRAAGAAGMSAGDFLAVLHVNLLGCYLAMKAVVPTMAAAGGGRVVNVSSTSGLTGRTTASAAYAAAKAGIDALTRSLAAEYGERGVLVSAVAPGKFRSPGWVDDPTALARYTEDIPLGRLAEPEDIGAAIRFLVSPRNNYITGHTMVIDGGRLA